MKLPVAAKFLPRHDLGVLGGAVLVGLVPGPHAVDVERVAVAVGVVARADPLAPFGVGVVGEPRRPFHDVGVGIVDDATFDVGHGPSFTRE